MKKVIIIITSLIVLISAIFIVSTKIRTISEQNTLKDEIVQYLKNYSELVENGPIYYIRSQKDMDNIYSTNGEMTFSEDSSNSGYEHIYFYQDNTYYSSIYGEISFIHSEDDIESILGLRISEVNRFFEQLINEIEQDNIKTYDYENGIYNFDFHYNNLFVSENAKIEIDTNTNVITLEAATVKVTIEQRFEILYEYDA